LSGISVREEAPSPLYKFVPNPRFLENSLFRFSQPGALNDPEEALPRVTFGLYAAEDYAEARNMAERAGFVGLPADKLETLFMDPYPKDRFDESSFPCLWPATVPELRPEPFESLEDFDRSVMDRAVLLCRQSANRELGIFSLTESTHDSMWAYYAADHTGMAVEFDAYHPFFSDNQSLFQVKYSDEPVFVSSNGGVIRVAGEKFEVRSILSGDLNTIPLELLVRKRLGWQHEREWRLITKLSEANEISAQDRDFPIYLFEVPPDSIAAIIFGLRADQNLIRHVADCAENEPKWSHLALRKRVQSPRGEALEKCW